MATVQRMLRKELPIQSLQAWCAVAAGRLMFAWAFLYLLPIGLLAMAITSGFATLISRQWYLPSPEHTLSTQSSESFGVHRIGERRKGA